MELLKSARYFFWGILRRFYFWLPFVALDIPDLWERYLTPFTGRVFGSELEMPATLISILVVASLAWAAVLTYHELRVGKVNLKAQLDSKGKKGEIRVSLGAFLEEGQDLKTRCANESKPPPEDKANEWGYRTEIYLEKELDKSYISRFRSSVGVPLAGCSISSEPHRKLWSGIHTRLYQLGKFMEQLGD